MFARVYAFMQWINLHSES